MFISALQPYAMAIIITVIVIQYAFALFCFFRLAYLDIPRKKYVMWNLLILIVFFIGGIVFLVYYHKHPELRIKKSDVAPHAEAESEKGDVQESSDSNDSNM